MRNLRHLLTYLLILFFLSTEAQFPLGSAKEIPDTIYKKSHLKSNIAVISLDAGIWAIHKFIRGNDYAQISLKSIKENLKCGIKWDNDGFETNMFNHPAHGSFAYNCVKFNGMSYWEALPYSLSSSLRWEFLFEIEPPSINDLISSTIGGLVIGEATNRISHTMHTQYKRGVKRIGSEIGSFLITPTETIHRLINGQLWKTKSKKPEDKFLIIPVRFQAGPGITYINYKNFNKEQLSASIAFNVSYNDPFALKKCKPFDYFHLKAVISNLSNQPFLNKLNIEAIIWGKNFKPSENQKLLVGVFQHYNFFETDTISSSVKFVPYKISVPASYGLGLMYMNEKGNLVFNTEIHFNGILTGAGLTDHYHLKRRNYNFGVGFSGKFKSSVLIKEVLKLNLDVHDYWLYTWDGIKPGSEIQEKDMFSIQGDKGNASYYIINPGIEIFIFKPVSFYVDMIFHLRKNRYAYYDFSTQQSTEFSGSVLYNF